MYTLQYSHTHTRTRTAARNTTQQAREASKVRIIIVVVLYICSHHNSIHSKIFAYDIHSRQIKIRITINASMSIKVYINTICIHCAALCAFSNMYKLNHTHHTHHSHHSQHIQHIHTLLYTYTLTCKAANRAKWAPSRYGAPGRGLVSYRDCMIVE